MKLTFTYDPNREVTPLRFGFRSTNSSKLTQFAEQAKHETIDIENVTEVAELSKRILIESQINSEQIRDRFQKKWDRIQPEAIQKLQYLFDSAWDPGDTTAYLTVSTRCPYNHKNRFFFVSFFKPAPMRTCLHELQHFYAHELLEHVFIHQNKVEKFNEFKESLTVLLNEIFADIIEEPDAGYPQHADSRIRILDDYRNGKSLLEMAEQW